MSPTSKSKPKPGAEPKHPKPPPTSAAPPTPPDDPKSTSPEAAAAAAAVLRDETATPAEKTAAGSALAQAGGSDDELVAQLRAERDHNANSAIELSNEVARLTAENTDLKEKLAWHERRPARGRR